MCSDRHAVCKRRSVRQECFVFQSHIFLFPGSTETSATAGSATAAVSRKRLDLFSCEVSVSGRKNTLVKKFFDRTSSPSLLWCHDDLLREIVRKEEHNLADCDFFVLLMNDYLLVICVALCKMLSFASNRRILGKQEQHINFFFFTQRLSCFCKFERIV